MFLDVPARILSIVLVLSLSAWTLPTAYAEEASGVVASEAPEENISEYVEAGSQPEDGETALHVEGSNSSSRIGVAGELESGDVLESASDESRDESGSDSGDLGGGWVIRSMCGDMQVLDIVGGSSSNGANVQTYRSNMSMAQRFAIELGEDGFAIVVNEGSGKALDVEGGVAREGSNVQLYERNGTLAQKWLVQRNGDGTVSLLSALDDGLALDVSGGEANDGTNVQLWRANGTQAQRFELLSDEPTVAPGVNLEPGVYTLSSALGSGLVADVEGASISDGARVQLWGANGTCAQSFVIVMDDEGYAVVMCVNSGKALDVASGNLVPGTKVQQWTRVEGAKNQLWSVQLREDGAYQLVSCSNGLALDVQGGQASPGTVLQAYTPNGSAAQGWMLTKADRLVQDGLYAFESFLGEGLVLDVAEGSFADGASAQIWTENGSSAQKFRVSWESVPAESQTGASADGAVKEAVSIQPLTGGGQYLTANANGSVSFSLHAAANRSSQLWLPRVGASGGVVFENVLTGTVLDVSGGGAWTGCPVGTYEENGTPAQSFRPFSVDPVSNGTYVVQSLADHRVLDVSGGSRSNGANVQAWSQNGSGAQAWLVEGIGDGYYRILNARSKKALDVTGGVSVSGTNVQQWSFDGVAAQKWRVEVNDDGSFSFVSACGGLALDVSGGGGFDGANVQVYERNHTAAQSFRLIQTNYVPEDFEDLIATFTTYSTNTPAGTYNMQRALNSFNGVVIQPGASLSFFAVAGPCGAAEGYLPAGVVGGVGYGGGICQASTTLYGTAIRAGFAILDRQNHSVPSTYVPIGLDAMVNWGTSDLVVRNDTGYPVKIVVHTYGNVLTCEMWGIQPDWYDSIEPSSWYTGPSSAAAQRTYYKDGRAVMTQSLPSSWYW